MAASGTSLVFTTVTGAVARGGIYDYSAPPFRRGWFGAAGSARPFRRHNFSAQRPFGAETIRRGDFSAPGLFGVETIRRRFYSALAILDVLF